MRKNNKKGFTLAELLIVVAIIAVLTAIAIPVFTGQLEKARVATDQANVRSWYAEQIAAYLLDDTKTLPNSYTGVALKAPGASAVPSGSGDNWTVTYTANSLSEPFVIGNGASGESGGAGGGEGGGEG